MRDEMGMPNGARPEIEATATDHTAVQQMREWFMTHKLEAHRGCSGSRIEELGLADLVAAPGRSRRQGRGDDSRPTFASA